MASISHHSIQLRFKDTIYIHSMFHPFEVPFREWFKLIMAIGLSIVSIYISTIFTMLYALFPNTFVVGYVLLICFDLYFIVGSFRLLRLFYLRNTVAKTENAIKIKNWRRIEISQDYIAFFGANAEVIEMIEIADINSLEFKLFTKTKIEYYKELSPAADLIEFVSHRGWDLFWDDLRDFSGSKHSAEMKFMSLFISLENGKRYDSGVIWANRQIHTLIARGKRVRDLAVELDILPCSKIVV